MSVERNKELKVNELTFSNLLSKEEYLDLKIKEYDEYLIQYSISQLNKKKRNTDYMIGKLQMNSVYGSYYFKSNELVDLGVLNQVYNIPDSRDLCFVLASDEPLKFKLHIFIDNCTITDPWIFRLEDLLMRKNEVIDVLQVCSFKVDMLIKVINQRYLGN
ncbi:calponin domain-containing protein [Vairimorpha apis BRL 01]|uniref:Calponin domain-containing protein n=1 Tax=Vairimorpha apis BRL 01 TaxID=1037528 RepID=T0L278_9MICR|nr:calponin domain-containing protein [Vairimorpha apis BRL 01]